MQNNTMKLKKLIMKKTLPIITATLIFFSGTGIAVASDTVFKQPVQTIKCSETTKLEDKIKDYSIKPIEDTLENTKETPKSFSERVKNTTLTKENATILAIGTGLTALVATQDNNLQEFFSDKDCLYSHSQLGDDIGQYGHIGSAVALYLGGKVFKNEKLATTGLAGVEALVINAIVTAGIKEAVGRVRPCDKGEEDRGKSFPSGHTSSSFTMATVASAMYDWDWKVAIPSYGLATFVGLSRMNDDAHYASDVFAGAVVGTLIGKIVADYHKDKSKEQKLFVAPVVNKESTGLIFNYRF